MSQWQRLVSLGGIAVFILICVVFSDAPKAIVWRPVFWGLSTQVMMPNSAEVPLAVKLAKAWVLMGRVACLCGAAERVRRRCRTDESVLRED